MRLSGENLIDSLLHDRITTNRWCQRAPALSGSNKTMWDSMSPTQCHESWAYTEHRTMACKAINSSSTSSPLSKVSTFIIVTTSAARDWTLSSKVCRTFIPVDNSANISPQASLIWSRLDSPSHAMWQRRSVTWKYTARAWSCYICTTFTR